MARLRNIITVACFLLASCAAAEPQSWTGKASYYAGRGQMTCAHRSLPFGTHVRVTNISNKRSAVLSVNDRGPFVDGRIVDVSADVADLLGFRHTGLAQVIVEMLPELGDIDLPTHSNFRAGRTWSFTYAGGIFRTSWPSSTPPKRGSNRTVQSWHLVRTAKAARLVTSPPAVSMRPRGCVRRLPLA